MKRTRVFSVVLFFLFGVSISNAIDIVYVDANSPNVPGSGTPSDPFRRIQDAINSANSGDTVKILPGIYTGQGNHDLDPQGKSITVRSTDPNNQNVIENTIIDPNNAGRGFYFNSGEDANCMVSGLTIRNGYTNGSGGAFCLIASSPTIRNCLIISNTAVWGGGGIYCYESNSTLSNCVIAGNMTNSSGGGFKFFSSDGPKIINCTICSNVANWYGGGFYIYDGSPEVTNCIVWANDTEEVYVETGNPVVSYCDIQGGWVVGTGNIDQYPCFVSFDPNKGQEMWDFHLQSAYGHFDPVSKSWVKDVNTSLCIDSGDPNLSWSAEPWPNGRRINMGAYGGTGQASMYGNPADFDIDGAVNFEDFADFAEYWKAAGNYIEDLNRDGSVNYPDLDIFADNWLWNK